MIAGLDSMTDEYRDALAERLHEQIMVRLQLRDVLARDDADEVLGDIAEWALMSEACERLMAVLEGVWN